jgi:hypothetical protein
MKHLTRIAAFLFAVSIFVACDKKEDPKPVSKLVGTWTGVSSQTIINVGGKTYKQYLIDQGFTEDEAEEFNALVEELLTLTGFFSEVEFKADGTWHGVTKFQNIDLDVTGKWTLSSDEKSLTLTNTAQPGVEKHATITELTETNLTMEAPGDEIDYPAGAEPGPITTTKVIAKLTRKK